MKINRNFVVSAVVLGFCTVAAFQAPAQILEKVIITGTAYVQGSSTDNNTTTTIKSPTKAAITTASLLKQLALDENFEGNWSSTTFPSSAKLDFNGTGFEVDQGTNELLDVSDMFTWTVSGQNDINSGNFLDANGAPSGGQGTPPFAENDLYIVTLGYNTSGAGTGALTFTASGLASVSSKAGSANSKTGNFSQAGTMSFADGTGEGVNSTGNFVLTGLTITASGSANENDGNGTGN